MIDSGSVRFQGPKGEPGEKGDLGMKPYITKHKCLYEWIVSKKLLKFC